ncbi:TRAP transporter small permease [Aurantimonas sp. C2-6-R+9]|uniref:TRAP transporter small permease n=1 Tax=unclassified Aurantimonas TaxID=2638230 RepID=UPI002E179D8E|nr:MULTISPECIES: TRAP transporter small permease [unclassified Aurantimonas]MEC5292473.1 TRAP transporter small permease [Aurantimonas sp. C2-3-R2]MEC5382702.1 TRAP transporter small permease [Aurantimonas sp. C2-6-R+9]MEC5413505.1 TRAP transporter small permease [Aurantimonas sp. C2-4-R8]
MLRTLDRYIWMIVDALLLLAVIAMVLSIGLQVVSRTANHSVPWTEELSRFLFIWTAFLGMATGFRQAEHPRVDLFVAMLPPRLGGLLVYLTPLCAAVFFGIAGWYGYRLMMQQIRFGETSPAMGLGMWLITLPVVLGAALAIFGSVVSVLLEPEKAGAASSEGTEGAI